MGFEQRIVVGAVHREGKGLGVFGEDRSRAVPGGRRNRRSQLVELALLNAMFELQLRRHSIRKSLRRDRNEW